MTSKERHGESQQAGPIKAVAYARVSSKEQEKEGFSIPAQQKLLQGYAQAQRVAIVQDDVDIETAKNTGRIKFEEMVRYTPTTRGPENSWDLGRGNCR